MAERKDHLDRFFGDLKDEARYAAADIRGAWERFAYGQQVTPNDWQAAIGRENGQTTQSPEQPEINAAVYGRDPNVPDALEGIGHAGDGTGNPDHTRDAVKAFYGQDQSTDYDQACRDFFAPQTPEPESHAPDHDPERSEGPSR